MNLQHKHSSFTPPPSLTLCKGRGVRGEGQGKPRFQTEHVSVGRFFSEILVEGTKVSGNSMLYGSSVGGTCRGWSVFS